jgi:hypothetical protein
MILDTLKYSTTCHTRSCRNNEISTLPQIGDWTTCQVGNDKWWTDRMKAGMRCTCNECIVIVHPSCNQVQFHTRSGAFNMSNSLLAAATSSGEIPIIPDNETTTIADLHFLFKKGRQRVKHLILQKYLQGEYHSLLLLYKINFF